MTPRGFSHYRGLELHKIDGLGTRRGLVFSVVRRWTWKLLGLERENQRRIRSMTLPPNPICRARQYVEALAAGEGASYATVGQQFGVSRIEVCHYVTVVRRLPADIVETVERETDARRLRRLSLRRLLTIARLEENSAKAAAFGQLVASLPPARSASLA